MRRSNRLSVLMVPAVILAFTACAADTPDPEEEQAAEAEQTAQTAEATEATDATEATEDGDRVVEDGGITVPGWMGSVDAEDQTIESASFAYAEDGEGLHITTGPAATYWNAENTVSGEYTVSATFTEPEYMNLNNHPHPYGIVVAGSEMGTDAPSYLYCATYGNGRFIVRGFGPEPFRLNGQRPTEHEAVNQAAGQGEPVSQEIAVTVGDDAVECAINGTVVGSYPMSDVVADGRLASTDGVYGIRAAHNTEVVVSDLAVTQN